MRTRILLAFATLLFPLVAYAATTTDRDILLTSDGTLYTAESVSPEGLSNIQTTSTRILTLTIQNGESATSTPVPASLSGGAHVHPALAYDAETATLFLFWEAGGNNGLSTELFFCSYHDGKWGVPTALASAGLTLRRNLRIAITTNTDRLEDDGTHTQLREITVHAVWWEDPGGTQNARYAMLTISSGNVAAIHVQDLGDFMVTKSSPANGTDDQELLRHPAVFESPNHSTVDVVFGDLATNALHRVTLQPVAQGRLRIPIGRGDQQLPPILGVVLSNTNDVSATSTSPDNLAFYANTDGAMRYFVLKNGVWTSRSVALNEKVTGDAVVDALRRMLSSD
jgi:hypothetical protein